jgi:hypothetical protein
MLLWLIEDNFSLEAKELRINLQMEVLNFRAQQFTKINIAKAAFQSSRVACV